MFCKRPRLKPAWHPSRKRSCRSTSPFIYPLLSPPHDLGVSQVTHHFASSMGSTFQAQIDGHIVIPGTHTAAGGTTNFNFGCPPTQDPPARPREPFSTVPFAPDPDFVDRPEIVAWVRDRCAGPGARAALVGLGGVGKSQLAIQYAHSIRDASLQTFVFWVHASTRARFEEAYRDIADRLQLPGRSDPKTDVLWLVSNWLRHETNGRWVIVLDNVDDVEIFFPSRKRRRNEADASAQTPLATYLPQSRNGVILVTSRSKDAAARLAGGYNKIREVLAMNESEGLQLLCNKLGNLPIEESAVELLRALDYIPLAITQAAAYISRRARMTVARYLDEFRRNSKKRESLLNWDADELRRDESASNSVVTTWQMSFEQIQRERPSAAELLSLMSFFNPQGIPESTLRRYSREATGGAELDNTEEAESAFEGDLDILQMYSLVSTTVDDDTCEMHALVQFCTRVWLSSYSDAEQWEQRFVTLMAQELPSGEFENWAKWQQLLPHVEPLFDAMPTAEEALKAWAQVFTSVAWYLCLRGSYSIAQEIAAKALTVREKALGLDDQQTLVSLEVLASVLRYQGKYNEAEKLNRRVLEGREKELGVQHPNTLTSVSNLALVLQNQGKYDEAEKLNRRALEGSEKELGVQHPDTLMSVISLASVLQDQGKYNKAEKLNRRALEGYEKELGVQHPDTLTSVSNLALVLQDQGKYDEAEKLNRRALEGYEKELGVQHPSTLTSVSNLASVLRYQGKYDEAAPFYADEREQPGVGAALPGEVRRSREAQPKSA
ncbi:TPR-like protein [Bimuria novae-zelandiae CBS 107.79]|uniref:TPR-like protein n=1 Tax=Bimuria novae-zelandiae CBS 107.79 TaxID=1447943 RepID=A0A6A5UGZ8_9PLEO|nr:TPR-like protein [Bimuria novae-zelandiae CBS 107.79]